MLGEWRLVVVWLQSLLSSPVTSMTTFVSRPRDRHRRRAAREQSSQLFLCRYFAAGRVGFLSVLGDFGCVGEKSRDGDAHRRLLLVPAVRAELRNLVWQGGKDTEWMCSLAQCVKAGRGTVVVPNGLSFRNAAFASGNDTLAWLSWECLK